MNYERANAYDPLAWNYLTHEDKCHLIEAYGLMWSSSSPDSKAVTLIPVAKWRQAGTVTKRIDLINSYAEKGDRFALKLIREITKAKLLGRLKVEE